MALALQAGVLAKRVGRIALAYLGVQRLRLLHEGEFEQRHAAIVVAANCRRHTAVGVRVIGLGHRDQMAADVVEPIHLADWLTFVFTQQRNWKLAVDPVWKQTVAVDLDGVGVGRDERL